MTNKLVRNMQLSCVKKSIKIVDELTDFLLDLEVKHNDDVENKVKIKMYALCRAMNEYSAVLKVFRSIGK